LDNIVDYFDELVGTIRASEWVTLEDLFFRQIDEREAYIKGVLYLHGGYELHVAEYVCVRNQGIEREKHRYQLLDADDHFMARWDNAPHHQDISTFPHHRHKPHDEIIASSPMSIPRVLQMLEQILKEP